MANVLICWLFCLGLIMQAQPVAAESFVCAHRGEPAAKRAQIKHVVTPRVLVIFARFADDAEQLVPTWGGEALFDVDQPGSFAHFYSEMSFGRMRPTGQVAGRRYVSAQPRNSYLSDRADERGAFDEFSLEILRSADRDIDFSDFDGDGDGVVDAIFIVLPSVPANFLLGGATGIADLGFLEEWQSADGVQVVPHQGVILQGRSFAETVGVMSHEFGHLLGLPDLFDKRFVQQGGDPEDDSAGIGNWGVMGWGASGWNGDDGPNSFCAWSRAFLGWGEIDEPQGLEREVALAPVGSSGQMYRIPLGEDEEFLLEYRTRSGSYYDRHIPGEGLLIWHFGYHGYPLPRFAVDLECADGNWLGAGYPLGTHAETGGEDNLDFWAHDADYTRAHRGNLGDATDPFDGTLFAHFTPDTNPSSKTLDGRSLARVEGVDIDGEVARFTVRTTPAVIVADRVDLRDDNRDGRLVRNEEAAVDLLLANRGGLDSGPIEVQLSTSDSRVEILRPSTQYDGLGVGEWARVPLNRSLAIKLVQSVEEVEDEIELKLSFLVGGGLSHEQMVSVSVLTTYTISGQVRGEDGAGLADFNFVAQVATGSATYNIKTDADGFYQAELPAGPYLIHVRPPQDSGFVEQYISQSFFGDRQYDIILRRPILVEGIVRDPEGHPIADVHMFVSFTQVTTAADGTFAVRLPRGGYTFNLSRESADPARNFPWQLQYVVVDEGEWVELTMQRGVRVNVELVDAVGVPARNTQFFMSGQATTNAQGRASLSVVPDIHPLSIFNSKTYANTVYYPFDIKADTTLRIVVERSLPFAGVARDPLSIASVRGQLHFVPIDGYTAFAPELEADGRFATGLPAGRYEAFYHSVHPEASPSQWLGQIDGRATSEMDFSVVPGEKIRGQLVDSDGRGLSGVEIQASSVAQRTATSALTGPGGVFELRTPAGPYELMAIAAGMGSRDVVRRELTALGEGRIFWNLGTANIDPLESLELIASTGASLSGRVMDRLHQPSANALVVLKRDPLAPFVVGAPSHWLRLDRAYKVGGDVVAAALTDDEGYYHIEAPPGTYYVVVQMNRYSGIGVVKRLGISGDEQADFTLPIPGRSVTYYGSIKYEQDQLRARVWLMFYDRQNQLFAYSSSQDGGGYRVDLSPGSYQVRAALVAPTGGFSKVYDLGGVTIEGDGRWDVDLGGAPTAVTGGQETIPSDFALWANYPNPFNPSTHIRYSLASDAQVELAIYDVLGRLVRRLVDNRQRAGDYVVQWDGRDDERRDAASGIYFYRVIAQSSDVRWVEARKLAIVR